jgi:putative membrane protein
MSVIAIVAVVLIALLHVYILVLEMFLWTAPRTRAGFGLTAEFAAETKALAANQGLYNGFLAAALVWGLVADDFQLTLYGLVCVIVAGLYGAATATKRILFVQVLPGALALIALLIAR